MKTKFLLHAALLGALFSTTRAADFTSTWNTSTGNWSDTTKWSTPGAPGTFPNNGSPSPTYDAVMSNGLLTVDQAITIQKFTMTWGVLLGPGTLTVNDDLTLVGGMNNAGTLTATGNVTLDGTGREMNNGFVLNLGDGAGPDAGSTTTWSSGDIVMRQGSAINNRSDSVINATANSPMSSNFNGAAVTFNNEGTFNQNGTGTTTLGGNSNPFVFSNSGLIQVNSGTLSIAGGNGGSGTNTGDFVIASGATLILGNMNLNAGTTFAGTGTVQFAGLPVSANVAATVEGNLKVNSVLEGLGTLNVNGLFTWDGIAGTSTIKGGGTINAKGGASFPGGGTELLNGRVLNLGDGTGAAVTATWSAGGFQVAAGAVINNRSNSTFTTTHDGIFHNTRSGTGGTINNEGIFTKNGGTGITYVGSPFSRSGPVNFNNSGTVNVNTGTLQFIDSYTQTAGALVLNGGGVSSGTFSVQGGKIQGGGTITGAVSVSTTNGVTFEPGIGTTTGTLAITGDLVLLNTNSKFRFDIGGITPGTHDQLTEGGTAVLNVNGVTLEVNLLNGFVPVVGDTVTVVDASGALINGSFANVLNGARLTLAGGLYSCQVNYGSGTAPAFAAHPDKVILSHFATTPTSLTLDDNQIVENAPGGSTVGLLSATDPDTNETLTFSLVSGTGSTDNALFQITGSQLQTKTTTVVNFETKTSYSVRLRVVNSRGGFLEQNFTIQVQDVPAPTALALSASSFPENRPVGHVIGTLSATNPPGGGDPVTFTVVSVDGSALLPAFAVSGGNLVTNDTFNAESTANGPFSVLVRATNQGGESAQQAFTITLLNEGPSNLALSPSSILEGRPVGTAVGNLSSTVVPDGTAVTYSLFTPTAQDNELFTIDGTAVKTATVLDFAVAATRRVHIRATDTNGESTDQILTISVIEAGPPTDIALSANTIAENQPANTIIGTLSATDPDPEAIFTFTLVDTANFPDNTRFNLSGSSLRSSQPFDAEAPLVADRGPFNIRVRVTNGAGEFYEETLPIIVTDIPSPSDIALSASSIAENQPANTVVGTLSATDPEPGATFTFALVSGDGSTDNGRFNILGTSLRTSQTFDKEAAAPADRGPFSIRVKVTNGASESYEETFSITLDDQGPSALALSPSTVLEGKANTPVGHGRQVKHKALCFWW